MQLTDTQKHQLLRRARQAIVSRFDHSELEILQDLLFTEKRGVFVSLHAFGNLRGCIGYIKGYESIGDSVLEMARSAAFRDPRFPALTLNELGDIEIEISILSEMIPIDGAEEVVIGRDGLYLRHPRGSGLLLPQVPVECKWNISEFLQHICLKAGLPNGAWKDKGAALFRFTAEVFHEDKEFFD
ncbi:MAG: AmmeMemoRadiSam system protein A [Candidatus Cloacimonadaceae bacterium]|nr:AmmeMemoRadiSam system protein A [Candidatus Cloacimonadaceae bacterium]MDP3115275.1 AmmeMemoRadiSam system protein A [Candidatus Cloacimonadaceae bacterium]